MPSRNSASVGGGSSLKLTTLRHTAAGGAATTTESSTSYSGVGPRTPSSPARTGIATTRLARCPTPPGAWSAIARAVLPRIERHRGEPAQGEHHDVIDERDEEGEREPG